ncbi:DUF4011 domain-containing protein [Brevibacterium sp. 50QC2O2]|uniref:DUF4011 domain-containing protein n=1 Tax=Brevibacterium TaxID=1696 RepID=UPI00211B9D0C|nr:DUF4011 domain-containing protein [Brevibacterium sp. 68QC2CO]MCQ9387782.1 DUF4011 domain-containing protein [Brevibacterium sp. 50QC2O2]
MSRLTEPNSVEAAFANWQEQAAKLGGRDTMLHFRDSRDGLIELTGAHPSGMAQLLAGRPTRLSSLIRDAEQLADARRRARSIRQKDEQLGYERGIAVAQLAIGFASWTKREGSLRHEFNAPILLRHVQLVPRGSKIEDYEIVLSDDITINPALRAILEVEHGVFIDADSWIDATRERGHGFDPQPVIDRLRTATKAVPGLLVNHRLVISTFANIAATFTGDAGAEGNPLLRALAGDVDAREALVQHAQQADPGAPGPHESAAVTLSAGVSDGYDEVIPEDDPVNDFGPAGLVAIDFSDDDDDFFDDDEDYYDEDFFASQADWGEDSEDSEARESAEGDAGAAETDAAGAPGRTPAESAAAPPVQEQAAQEQAAQEPAGQDSAAQAQSGAAESPATAAPASDSPAIDAARSETPAQDSADTTAESDRAAASDTDNGAKPQPWQSAAASQATGKVEPAAGDAEAMEPAGSQAPKRTARGADGSGRAHKRRLTVENPRGRRRRKGPIRRTRHVAKAPTPLPDRDPADEFLVLDVDGDQQAVVDAALGGGSFVVHTPAGSGATQVAVATATSLAHQGKNVLYVAASSDALDAFAGRLAAAGLPDLLVDGRAGDSGMRKRLVSLIVDAERAQKPDLAKLVEELTELRGRLRDHTQALHRERKPWRTSVHSTMEHLARLTGRDPGPQTAVRFGPEVMDATPAAREVLRETLLEFSNLGAFTLDVEDTVWFGAKLDTNEQAEDARQVAESAAGRLPKLIAEAEPVLRAAHLNPPRTVGDWGQCLRLLGDIEKTLERFAPDIYEADLDLFIGATGSSEYRRERGLNLGMFERGRIKREAREFVRSGLTVEDLHAALLEVRDERERFNEFSYFRKDHQGAKLPVVPPGLDSAKAVYEELAADLDRLMPVLVDTPDGGDLAGMLVEELQARLEAMADDRESLAELPARTELEVRLRAGGLGDLLDDLRGRRVRHAMVGDEFDLAYWATVLQQMATEDAQITGLSAAELDRIVADYRRCDSAFVAAGAQRLRYAHAQAWKRAIQTHKDQAEVVRSELRGDYLHLDRMTEKAPDVVGALAPIWMMSPYQVPQNFGDVPLFDTVILADAAMLSVVEAAPAITRAKQVIALGDERLLGPREFSVSVDRRTPGPEDQVDSVFSALADFLPQYQLHTTHRESPLGLSRMLSGLFYDGMLRALPSARTNDGPGLELAYVPDGLGSPDTATGQVESLEVEVQRVVDLVLRHARTRSRESLAVVALTPWHAQRVATAIQQAIRTYPYVASFFSSSGDSSTGAKEPFVVTDAARVQGIVRDAVIFSLGYGRTLQGRVIYNFGALGEPGGERLLAAVATRARRRLSVVSCFDPADFEPTRLKGGAALLPDFLRGVSMGSRLEARARAAAAGVGDDPLVADIAWRLRKRGLAPVERFAGIDLALPLGNAQQPAPAETGMVMAIESDGPRYALTGSIRERERLRAEALEARGWTYRRLWSAAAFVDPQEQANGLLRLWQQQVEELSPQSVLDAARAAAVVVSRQGSRPKVSPGLPVHAYSVAALDAMVDWIQSDGVYRTDAELIEQLRQALALKPRAVELSDSLTEAVGRYRRRVSDRREEGFAPVAAPRPDAGTDESEGSVARTPAGDSDRQPGRPADNPDPKDEGAAAPSQAAVMPSYDTSLLREEHLIDAGLRPEERDEGDDRA